MANIVSPEIREKRINAGRIGGQTTVASHGTIHMSNIGKLGGRPRNLSLSEITASYQNNNKKGELPGSYSLNELKRRYQLKKAQINLGDLTGRSAPSL